MPARDRPRGRPGRRTSRDRRRRALGQNFLVDQPTIDRIVDACDVGPDELIVEPGPGRGALTVPLARRGARVLAIERDRRWAAVLRARVADLGLDDRITVRIGDALTARLPSPPYRVVANPPFGATTDFLGRFLDDPPVGPDRVDLVVQAEVARKRAAQPPTTLRSAAWAPWWEFTIGPGVDRSSFRPVPTVDGALLTVRRRRPPVLPEWLAPAMRDTLRDRWEPPPRR